MTDSEESYGKKVWSALFYAAASFSLTVVNKTVLTTYGFPSYQVLGLGQLSATIVMLSMLRCLGLIDFEHFRKDILWRIWPLPVLHLGGMLTGLGGTKELNLPMFCALRRFSIMMTMIAEYFVLKIKISCSTFVCVSAMIAGALIAVGDDVTFNLEGYVLVMANNAFTAINMVTMKKKLNAKDFGTYGLLFYNSLFVIMPAVLIAWQTGDLKTSHDFVQWNDYGFTISFLASSVMGCLLSYSIALCTFYNGALTTTIIGCLKNISTTYLGLIIGGDYVFTWINFIGLNIGVIGSLFYTYVTFSKPTESNLTSKISNVSV